MRQEIANFNHAPRRRRKFDVSTFLLTKFISSGNTGTLVYKVIKGNYKFISFNLHLYQLSHPNYALNMFEHSIGRHQDGGFESKKMTLDLLVTDLLL